MKPAREQFSHKTYTMLMAMRETGQSLLGTRETDKEVSGSGDTGTVVLQSDLANSEYLLGVARKEYPGSFSEEDDPRFNGGLPSRLMHSNLWMVDPVDGTGDRKYGKPGTASGDGYSILSTFLARDSAEIGIAVRPAHNSAIVHAEGETSLVQLDSLLAHSLMRIIHPRRDGAVRVNVRPAYPKTHMPPDFWEYVEKFSGITFKEAEAGGAGDSLSRLLLGNLDVVIARVGDWKAWDTGPFDKAIRSLGGRMTDGRGEKLRGYREVDLWHRQGVIASILNGDAHDALVYAIKAYERDKKTSIIETR